MRAPLILIYDLVEHNYLRVAFEYTDSAHLFVCVYYYVDSNEKKKREYLLVSPVMGFRLLKNQNQNQNQNSRE